METHIIDRLGARGDGVAPGPLYAPFTLPGERVEGATEGDRILSARIVTASTERRPPPCLHFGQCGGCALQHASDPFVAAWKRDQIAERLAAAGVTPGEIRQTETSPPGSRRRAAFTARRTKKTVEVGFLARASDHIIPIENCEILLPALMAARHAIADLARIGASRKGPIKATATASETGLDLSVEGGKPPDRQLTTTLADIATHHDLARLAWNGEVVVEARAPYHVMGEAQVTPPPGGFLQASRHGEETLTAAAREALGKVSRIADLFSGCGAFTLPFARDAEIHAVEADPALLSALKEGWRKVGGLKRVETEARDLFRRPLIGDELGKLDGLVIDPPRAGAKAQSEAIAKHGPPVIAAISCDPATFARDARILTAGGYRLDWVLPVDQFRWSAHIELAARFSR